ncbi:hypothetical protein J19TS2_11470 [Cohnella xylanilytica]|nr:hypothetical protein J19TS2_11470 [Cohnella xylanilytica]
MTASVCSVIGTGEKPSGTERELKAMNRAPNKAVKTTPRSHPTEGEDAMATVPAGCRGDGGEPFGAPRLVEGSAIPPVLTSVLSVPADAEAADNSDSDAVAVSFLVSFLVADADSVA